MGSWGPALFSDDLARDVRDTYRELIEDGIADDDATRRVIERYASVTDDPDEGPVFWLALAHTQSKVGRLDPAVRARALAILDHGAGLHLWQDDARLLSRRKAALEKVRAQLTGPQPERKKLRPPPRHVTDLSAGDVLAYRAGDGYALFRVARISESRVAVAPVLVRLRFSGEELPDPRRLRRLRDVRLDGPRGAYLPGYLSCCLAMTIKKVDYSDAGFRTIGRIDTARRGDAERAPGSYVDWRALARSLDEAAGASAP
jgi:hypothetical protein